MDLRGDVRDILSHAGPWEALAVGHIGALALLLDERFSPKLLWLEPAWVICVFLAVPLGGALIIDRRSTRGVFLGLITLLLGVWPGLYWSFAGLPRDWYQQNPAWIIAPAAAAAFIGGIGAWLDLDRARWGLSVGDLGWWGPRVAAICLGIVPFVLLAALLFPSLLEYYPSKVARGSAEAFIGTQLGRGVYFVGWEFFYRGFLLFGLGRTVGPGAAALIQAYPFFILHRAKPVVEMMSSYTGGLALSWFCWKAGSFWPAFLLHWMLNLTMECVGLLG